MLILLPFTDEPIFRQVHFLRTTETFFGCPEPLLKLLLKQHAICWNTIKQRNRCRTTVSKEMKQS